MTFLQIQDNVAAKIIADFYSWVILTKDEKEQLDAKYKTLRTDIRKDLKETWPNAKALETKSSQNGFDRALRNRLAKLAEEIKSEAKQEGEPILRVVNFTSLVCIPKFKCELVNTLPCSSKQFCQLSDELSVISHHNARLFGYRSVGPHGDNGFRVEMFLGNLTCLDSGPALLIDGAGSYREIKTRKDIENIILLKFTWDPYKSMLSFVFYADLPYIFDLDRLGLHGLATIVGGMIPDTMKFAKGPCAHLKVSELGKPDVIRLLLVDGTILPIVTTGIPTVPVKKVRVKSTSERLAQRLFNGKKKS